MTHGIIWDCPKCGSDEAQYHRRGKLSGIAVCKDCNNTWTWKAPAVDRPQRQSSPEHTHISTESDMESLDGLDPTPKSMAPGITVPDESITPSYSLTEDDTALEQLHGRLESFRQRFANRRSTSTNGGLPPLDDSHASAQPKERLGDDMTHAWPKASRKKPAKKKRSYDEDSSASEFEYDEADEDEEDRAVREEQASYPEMEQEEDVFAKPKSIKGKGLATSSTAWQPANHNKMHHLPDNEMDDADNDSIFSDTYNDMYDDDDLLYDSSDQAEANVNQAKRWKNTTLRRRAANKKHTFIAFNQENRRRIANENPGISGRELSRLVGVAYRQMSQDERERLRKQAAQFKDELWSKRPKKTALPSNGYVLFFREQSKVLSTEQPGLKLTDLNVIISRMWREKTADEKIEYRQRAKKLHNDFARDNPEEARQLQETRKKVYGARPKRQKGRSEDEMYDDSD